MANDIVDKNNKTESYSFMLIDFMAVAMINYIREDCKNFINKNSIEKRSK